VLLRNAACFFLLKIIGLEIISGQWKRNVRQRTVSWCSAENQVLEMQRDFEVAGRPVYFVQWK